LELVEALYQRRRNFAAEMRAASLVYAFSNAVSDFYRSIPWFPTVPIQVYPMGILRPFSRTKLVKHEPPLKIATWGGQTPLKGTHVLLDAAARPELRGKVEVHVFGSTVDPEYQERLERLAKGCGAVLHGFFTETQKETFGGRFDLAVFPTEAYETYCIVVDEALSMGMPVIATKPGAQSERIGDAGTVVPAGVTQSLVKAIESFLDPKVLLKAARAARNRRIHTMDAHWLELHQVYLDLAARRLPRDGQMNRVRGRQLPGLGRPRLRSIRRNLSSFPCKKK
jgi:glycosyltransferase involved in cell wall biosynthesis